MHISLISDTESNTPRRRSVYTATILEEMGIDTSNLPKGSKLINRKDKVTGEDTWYIQLFFHTPAIVKDLEGQELLRQACWFHARHYLVDAYLVDSRMEILKKMRAAGDEYGQMVHRAVDYILDDEDAFRTFLSDGRIDMHNIAIERCFRHIAMGRRNWLQTGSHFSA